MNFNISNNAKMDLMRVGRELTPIILIDNFLENPEQLITAATEIRTSFSEQADKFYPGIRAPLPVAYVQSVLLSVLDLIRYIYKIPAHLEPFVAPGNFSLVTRAPDELKPVQKIPHFDSSRQYEFAILLYLNKGDFGGTSFYRHKATGYEVITAATELAYCDSVNASIDSSTYENAGYFTHSTKDYERIGSIEYKPNRLAIYPGALLHSGDINPASINQNPQTGRLTTNIMVAFDS